MTQLEGRRTIRVTIRFFGPARDSAGADSNDVTIDDGQCAGDLLAKLQEQYPAIAALGGVRLAVNRKYAAANQRLQDGDEIAVIPPVSGG
ncbi:MAG: MoaD/ThiS family protein [Phycisphaerae bacterium]|nr:MoaD/ThiS family protein [Phycisphaerae bacterium]